MAAAFTNSASFFLDGDGSVWLAGQCGLKARNFRHNWGFEKCNLPDIQDITSIAVLGSSLCCADSNGQVWSFQNLNQKPMKFRTIGKPIALLSCANSYLFALDNEGGLWNITSGATLIAENVDQVACGTYCVSYTSGDDLFVLLHGTNVPKTIFTGNISSLANWSSLMFVSDGNCYCIQQQHLQSIQTYDVRPKLVRIQMKPLKVGCDSQFRWILDEEGNLWKASTYQKDGFSMLVGITNVSSFMCGPNWTFIKLHSEEVYGYGNNSYYQLGLQAKGNIATPSPLPKNVHSLYSDETSCDSCVLKDLMEWKVEDIEEFNQIKAFLRKHKTEIEKIKKQSKIPAPSGVHSTWKELENFLDDKMKRAKQTMAQSTAMREQRLETVEVIEQEIEQLKQQLKERETLLPIAKKELNSFNSSLKKADKTLTDISSTQTSVKKLSKNEQSLNTQLRNVLKKKSLAQQTEQEVTLVLWKMNLCNYQKLFQQNHIDGKMLCFLNEASLLALGMKTRDVSCFLFHVDMMNCTGYNVTQPKKSDCTICLHNTPELTIDLLHEYEIEMDEKIIRNQHWIAPYLLYGVNQFITEFKIDFASLYRIQEALALWKEIHEDHLHKLRLDK
uniref:SAM domain-containing protein n=1 Tax=Vannella robusta TaxID=1487602 RepID=A0A7S4HSP3_9EUKA|mmetsp:Transcript_15170/g.19222  ORF Transcript_15170/g.19222 Transcript_15170/m.19222 type:complete len:615 (+) Transcript_15170:18-1862(+)